jgi:GNAT superfamily N-acetyltransferase
VIWRAMTGADLASVDRIADAVHPPHLFEPREAFESRLALGADHCFTLARDGEVFGYAVAHPWDGTVPKLAAILSPASPVSTLWLHDLALVPTARGRDYADAIVGRLKSQAVRAGLPTITLVAVNGTAPYWGRRGFSEIGSEGLESYGDGASLMRWTA